MSAREPAPGRDGSEKRGCLAAALRLLAGVLPGREPLPYKVRDHFLSPAEYVFYRVLLSVIRGRLVVCPKVRLGDLFHVTYSKHAVSHRNRINQKHVDFVLCDLDTMQPVAAIELDDSSHNLLSRRERDAFVEDVFKAAGLPLVRFRVRRRYDVGEITDALTPFLP